MSQHRFLLEFLVLGCSTIPAICISSKGWFDEESGVTEMSQDVRNLVFQEFVREQGWQQMHPLQQKVWTSNM